MFLLFDVSVCKSVQVEVQELRMSLYFLLNYEVSMQHQLVRDSATSCIAIEHCVSTSVGEMESRLYMVYSHVLIYILLEKNTD